MYGRGAADMKAGVVAMLGAAARAARRSSCAATICVETVIEEECTGNGAAACRARGPRTDAAIIPEPFNHARAARPGRRALGDGRRRGQGRARRARATRRRTRS